MGLTPHIVLEVYCKVRHAHINVSYTCLYGVKVFRKYECGKGSSSNGSLGCSDLNTHNFVSIKTTI